MSTRRRLSPKRLLHFGRLFAIAGVGLTVLAHQWTTPLMLLGAERLVEREMGILPDLVFALAVLCVAACMIWVLIERNPGLEAALKRAVSRDRSGSGVAGQRVDWRARWNRARRILAERRSRAGEPARSMSDRAAEAMDVLLLGSADTEPAQPEPATPDEALNVDATGDSESDPFGPPPAAPADADELFPHQEGERG